eukprot:scaffold143289_cov87-Phaeocystis_antarctica.AAC.1
MRAGRREAAGDRGASSTQRRARLQIGSRARGGAHPEHVGHGHDAGGVEAQRLVERIRALPRVERRAYDVGRGAEYREAGGGVRPRCVLARRAGRARLQIRSRAREGAHVEHLVRVRDSGGVEAQRLVERRRALPRVKRRAYGGCEVQRTGRPEAAGDRGARAACRGGLDCRLGAGHGEERTKNMPYMFVTMEVSKLSGWLNAYAACRESKGEHIRGVRGAQRTGRPEVAGDRGASGVQGRARLQIGSRAGGGAHSEHVSHVRDAAGVEAQRLVERIRRLPRVERRAYGVGRGAEYREAGGGGRPRCTQRAGQGLTADREQGTGRSARRTCRTCS